MEGKKMSKSKIVLMALLALSITSLCSAASFRIAALPDTQLYSQDYPAIFTSQTQWIVNNKTIKQIEFVTHLGDVVNHGDDSGEWANALTSMAILDGQVPYSVCAGNHDYHVGANKWEGPQEFLTNFGASRYSGYGWYGGTDRQGLSHYQIFTAAGRDWLHLNLEFAPDDEVLQWAQGVIDANPTLPVIVSSHLLVTDSPEDADGFSGIYAKSGAVASNGGLGMYFKFIAQNDQIFMTLNGHHAAYTGVNTLNYPNEYGNNVLMMLSDYQAESNGGNGYMRLIEIDLDNNQINIQTYSPYLNDYKTDATNEFSIAVDFSTRLSGFASREVISTVQAANIEVTEVDSFGAVTVSIPAGQSTANIRMSDPNDSFYSYSTHNKGDYYPVVGITSHDDALGGVYLASVTENSRQNLGEAYESRFTVGLPIGAHGQTWIAVSEAAQEIEVSGTVMQIGGGNEGNCNVAAAYFPFSGGWTCGNVRSYGSNNDTEGDEAEITTRTWCVNGSPDVVMGVNLTQYLNSNQDPNLVVPVPNSDPASITQSQVDTDRGVWELTLDGIDSITDGVLMVCSGLNEDNYAACSPWPDGSGWQIVMRDNGASGATESDSFNFVYVPYSTEGIVAGRVSGSGGIQSGTGNYWVVRTADGVELYMDDFIPEDGTLIVTNEHERYGGDNYCTYEPDGDHWVVQQRDLPESYLAFPTMAMFSFVFVPFDTPPSGPGLTTRTFDYTQVLAGNFETTWDIAGSFIDVQKLQGSEWFEESHHNSNYYYYNSVNGTQCSYYPEENTHLNIAAGITLGSVREFPQDRGDGAGVTLPTFSSREGNRFALNYPSAAAVTGTGRASFSSVWIPRGSGYTWGDVRDTGVLYDNGTYGPCYEGSVPTITASYLGTAGRFKYEFADATPADGIIFTCCRTTGNLISTVMPLADGWEVTTRTNLSAADAYDARWVRYAFLPYENLRGNVLAHVADDGTIVNSTYGVTVTKLSMGTYQVDINGKTPEDGALLLTPYDGDTATGAINACMAYEPDGTSFIIKCFDLNTYARTEIDCDFGFAFIPFEAAALPFTGSGTEADPYQIWTRSELEAIKLSLTSYYKLMTDLNLSSTTYDGMVVTGTFMGTFDGDYHTITGLTIDSAGDNAALFGTTAVGSMIKNLTLTNANVSGVNYVAPLVAMSLGDISNCHSSGVATGTTYVGGLFAAQHWDSVNASVSDCSSSTTVTGGERSGGLAGYAAQCVVDNCFATGDVNVPDNSANLGGLFGMLSTNGVVTNCYATGAVSGFNRVGGLIGNIYSASVSDSYATGNVIATGTEYVGGLAGQHNISTATNCYATGSVTATNADAARIGGLLGNSYCSSTTDSYATGNVSGGKQYVGGCVGYDNGTSSTYSNFERCFATGSVTPNSNNPQYVGGFTGRLYYGNASECFATGDVTGYDEVGSFAGRTSGASNVTNCYATGDAQSPYRRVGGFIGGSWGVVTNCYSTGIPSGTTTEIGGFVGTGTSAAADCFWDTETSGFTTSAVGTGKITAEMMAQATFTNWDFATVWTITEGVTYPQFPWQPVSSADLNTDGVVDVDDLMLLAADWLQSGTGLTGDIDGNGSVDLVDFSAMAAEWD